MNYKIIVDYGKPFDIDINTEQELKQELKKLRELSDTEDFAHFDIEIEFKETEFIKRAKEGFKKQKEYLDFTDYLINVSCGEKDQNKKIEYIAIVNYVLGYLGLNPSFKKVDEAINSFLKHRKKK